MVSFVEGLSRGRGLPYSPKTHHLHSDMTFFRQDDVEVRVFINRWLFVSVCKLLACRPFNVLGPASALWKSDDCLPDPKAGHHETPQYSTHHVVMQASSSKSNAILNHGALSYERLWPSVALSKIRLLRKGESQFNLSVTHHQWP